MKAAEKKKVRQVFYSLSSLRIHKDRRAVSPWISWVLLMALAVLLSAMMYEFMVSYTEDSTEDVKKIVYNTDECRYVSVNVDYACLSSQVLNITLENRNYIRIDKLDFRLYEGRVPFQTNQTEISMNPNRKKTLGLDTGSTRTTTLVEVIPHIIKEEMDIICSDRKAQADVSTC